MSEKTSSAGAPVGAEAPPDVPARWSAARKTETGPEHPRPASCVLKLAEDLLEKRGYGDEVRRHGR